MAVGGGAGLAVAESTISAVNAAVRGQGAAPLSPSLRILVVVGVIPSVSEVLLLCGCCGVGYRGKAMGPCEEGGDGGKGVCRGRSSLLEDCILEIVLVLLASS
jgi:hypothetical protein